MTDTSAPDATRHATLRYQPGLDGLRAISILAVIAFHHYFLFGTERGWLPGGFLGVEVFFVVSGYLITSLLLAERRTTGGVSLRDFWYRRGRRLLPALWTLLIVVVAYSLVFLPDTVGVLKGDVVAALLYVSNWWQIIAERSYAAAVGRPELLKHLWSLAIEEQFYLIWPLALLFGLRKLGRHRLPAVLTAIALVSTLLLGVIAIVNIDFAYYATFTRLSGLLLGSVMAFYFAPYRIRGRPAPGARIALDIAGAVGLLTLLISFRTFTFPIPALGDPDKSVFFGGFLLVDIATLLAIAAAVHPASDFARLLAWRPLRWIGLRSYSLYLWHYPIFCVTRPRVDFAYFFHLRGWPVLVVRLALTFGFAELSYRFIETPIRNGAIGRYRDRLRAAHGSARFRLARRGALAVAMLTFTVFVLGMGLANAEPPPDRFGDARAGDVADEGAIAALKGAPTSAGPQGTGTTVAGATAVTTPPASPVPPGVLGIGDSVMQGASVALEATVPGMAIDATKSRQFGEAVGIMEQYRDAGALPATVVVHLGTNGRATEGAIDQVMEVAGPDRTVYFVTARVPRVWEGEVNENLHAGQGRHANARVLEWRDYAGCHDDWFVNDGFHLTGVGQQAYADFVNSGINGNPLTACVL